MRTAIRFIGPNIDAVRRESRLNVEPVLVTGGCGYVGRELVRQLVELGHTELHILDNLAAGERRLASMDRSKFTLHRCDIRDAAAVKDAMRRALPRVIYHLAAMHYIPACESAPGDAVAVNVGGTANVLEHAPEGAVFVLASTAAVYAPGDEAHVERDEAIGPIDVYGITKRQAEELANYYGALKRKVRAVIVRLFNVVGPGETNPHLLPEVARQFAEGNATVDVGNLYPRRDYIDVSDAARGFLVLADAGRGAAHPVICNLGTGRSHSVEEVLHMLGRCAGMNYAIRQDPARMRAVDRPMLRASTARLKLLTGWIPETPLEETMCRVWAARFDDLRG